MASNVRSLGEQLDDPQTINHPNLSAAMAAAFAEIEAATKEALNPHFKSKYADFGAVLGAIKPPLIKHGLFVTQRCHPDPDGVSVETMLHHSSGEKESLGVLYVPANKRDPQGFGSALTYCKRYALQTAFCVPVEDDDGNAAVQSAPRAAASPKPTGFITEKQRDDLEALASEAGIPTQQVCAAYGVDDLARLPADKFDRAVSSLKRAAERTKEPA